MNELKNYLYKFDSYYCQSQNQQMEFLISSNTDFFHYFANFIDDGIKKLDNYSYDSIANFIRGCVLRLVKEDIYNLYIVLFFCYRRYYASSAALSELPEKQIDDHFYGIFKYSEDNKSFYITLKNDFMELIDNFPRQQQKINIIISNLDKDTIDLLTRFVLTVLMFDVFVSYLDLFDVVEDDEDINSEAEYFSLGLYCECFKNENCRAQIKEKVFNES